MTVMPAAGATRRAACPCSSPRGLAPVTGGGLRLILGLDDLGRSAGRRGAAAQDQRNHDEQQDGPVAEVVEGPVRELRDPADAAAARRRACA
jgi:hypothetical protein